MLSQIKHQTKIQNSENQQLQKPVIKAPTVNCPSQETEVTSISTRSVENVFITTKGLQDRNNLLLDGRMVENKGKLILTEIFSSVQNMIFKSIQNENITMKLFHICNGLQCINSKVINYTFY